MAGIEALISVAPLLVIARLVQRQHLGALTASRSIRWSVGLAYGIAMSTFSLCALALLANDTTPPLLGALSPRHLLPMIPFTGWISLGIVAIALLGTLEILISARLRRNHMRRHLMYAPTTDVDGIRVATVPSPEFLATVVPGSDGCILVSTSAVDGLSTTQMRAIVHHENAHQRLGHHRQLLFARTVERSLWFIPGIRRATRDLRHSLEFVADQAACDFVQPDEVRSALVAFSGPNQDEVRTRLDALARTSRDPRWQVVLSLALASILAIGFELTWVFDQL